MLCWWTRRRSSRAPRGVGAVGRKKEKKKKKKENEGRVGGRHPRGEIGGRWRSRWLWRVGSGGAWRSEGRGGGEGAEEEKDVEAKEARGAPDRKEEPAKDELLDIGSRRRHVFKGHDEFDRHGHAQLGQLERALKRSLPS